jgi:feruloyl esterase
MSEVHQSRTRQFIAIVAIVFLAPRAFVVNAAPGSCGDLVSVVLRSAKVTSAADVSAGAFTPPSAQPGRGVAPAAARAFAAAPAFCRATVTAAPTSDSDIKIEVWLPKAGWNGKFQAVGNGGFAGTISYPALAAALTAGYAAASTDTGHSTPGASFALGHPEKLIDYAHRSLHEMAVSAKALITAYYGSPQKVALWTGCSTGGNQGLTIASKYPADFDAIVAGAPPDPRARLMGVRLLINRLVNRTPGSHIPPEKYPAIHKAALEACDKADGVADGVIPDPRACRFDPKVLQCTGADGPSCLTALQVETAKLIYSEVKHPTSNRVLYPSLLVPGSELNWATLAGPQPFAIPVDAFRHLAFKDPAWDPSRFDPGDIELMDEAAAVLNTVTPDLRPFFKRGGKLLMYHGWNDQQVPAMSSVTYFEKVLQTAGRQAAGKSIQLYMVPGMNHCQGGPGTDTFDKVAAMEDWIARGTAPAQILASHSTDGKVDRSRPLCPYPQIARYKGAGSEADAGSFACVAR